jgi:hypothetical protein
MTDRLLPNIRTIQSRLHAIEEACLGSTGGENSDPLQLDRFLQLKSAIEMSLSEMRDLAIERSQLLTTAGPTADSIQIQARLRSLEVEVSKDLQQLREIYRKQSAGSIFVFSKNTSNQKELNLRYAQLDSLYARFDEVKRIMEGGKVDEFTGAVSAAPASGVPEAEETSTLWSLLFGGSPKSKSDKPNKREYRTDELDEHEKQAITNWKDAEKQIDSQVDQIGEVVDRIGEVANEITMTGKKQQKMLDLIQKRTDKTATNLRQVTRRLRQVLDTDRKSTFAFRIILLLVFMGLSVWIWQRIKNKST